MVADFYRYLVKTVQSICADRELHNQQMMICHLFFTKVKYKSV